MSIKTTFEQAGAIVADLAQQTKNELKEFGGSIAEKAGKVKDFAHEKLGSIDEVNQQPTVEFVEHVSTAEEIEELSLLARMISLIREPELLRGKDEYIAICRKVAELELSLSFPIAMKFREFEQKFGHLKLPVAPPKTAAPVSPVRVSPEGSGSEDNWFVIKK